MEMTCPKCQGRMRQYERNSLTIDQCTECRGIFLDRGELERLIDAEAAFHESRSAAPASPPPAPGGPPPAPGSPPPAPPPAPGAPPPPPPPSHGAPPPPAPPPAPAPAYGQGYGQGYGHGHHKKKRRESFLGDLFDF